MGIEWLNLLGRDQRARERAAEKEERLALESSIEAALKAVPQVSKERTAAPAELSELHARPREGGQQTLAPQPRPSYSLAVLALEDSERAVSYDPRAAIGLARLAGGLATSVDPRTCGGRAALIDLQAYALAAEGNAWRVSGNLQKALETFTAARQVQERGRVDPDLMGRIDRLEASLRRDLRQLDTSLTLLDRAARLFKSIKAGDQLARTVINQSNVFHVKGDFERAAALLESARRLAREPYLVLCINHNLSDILARSGRPREAARLLEQMRDVYRDFSDPLTASRRLWVEGVIARELGEDLDRAGEMLTEVTSCLANLGYSLDATLARFDLALLYTKRKS